MKLGDYIYFNIRTKKIEFADEKVTLKSKRIGKISKSYIKDGKLWVNITIDQNKVKKIHQKILGIE